MIGTSLRRLSGRALAATALALSIAPAAAQERFSEQVRVSEVVVPVRVLVKGEPLPGLEREDFELYDGGVRREILGFEERRIAAAGAPAARGPGSVSAAGRNLLLLVDFAYSRPHRLSRAFRELQESLPGQLGPSDRVAVATYGELSKLNLLTGFTADREILGLALDAVQAMLAAKNRPQRSALEALHEARFGRATAGSTFDVLSRELGRTAALAVLSGPVVYDELEDEGVTIERKRSFFGPIRVRVGVDLREPVQVLSEGARGTSGVRGFGLSLAELAHLLREVEGPREMVLVSEGFGGDLLSDPASLLYLQKALRALRDAGWTLHAIDAGGLGGLDDDNFSADSLLLLAEGTGGDLMEGTNDFSQSSRRLLERTAVVYYLTFQPESVGGENDFRTLDVRLARPVKGARLYHREGYYSRRAPARRDVLERRVDGAEWLEGELEIDELDVEVYAETVIDPVGGGMRSSVVVEVDGDALLAGGSNKPSRVELQLVVREGDHIRTLLSGERVIAPGSERETLSRGGVRFEGDLGLPPGAYTLRLLVRSHRQGEVVLRTLPLTIGAGVETGLKAPVERSPRDWIEVQAETRRAYFTDL